MKPGAVHLTLLLCWIAAMSQPELKEIRTAGNNVLVAFFMSDHVDRAVQQSCIPDRQSNVNKIVGVQRGPGTVWLRLPASVGTD